MGHCELMGTEKPSMTTLIFYLLAMAFWGPFLNHDTVEQKVGTVLFFVWCIAATGLWLRQYVKWRRDPAPHRPIRYERPSPSQPNS